MMAGIGLPAGDFSSWLIEVRESIEGAGTADVSCGTCVACCSSSQFVHIRPEERDALAHIPKALLFPAPRMPRGHVLMGYDEHGRCPMLRAEGCSIYEHRPRTCRTYDCRVFPAAGVLPDESDKVLIAERAERWQFALDGPTAIAAAAAVRATAVFLRDRRCELEDEAPNTTTQLAVAAVRVHDLFIDNEPTVPEVRVRLTSSH